MRLIVIFLLALCIAGVRSDNTCTAEVSAVGRPGGYWEQDGSPYQLYDILIHVKFIYFFFDAVLHISVSNTGTCEIASLVAYFDVHNSKTTQSWNFNSSVGNIYSFGTLSPGEISLF